MAALFKSLEHGIATGTAQTNPERYEHRLQLVDNREIGAVPLYFDPMQREAWNELVDRIWWLNASDYQMVEATAVLVVQMRITQHPEVIMKLVNCLAKLGATPTSRGNVLAGRSKDEKKSRFAK